MSVVTGGCLCGALRYEATGEPTMAGHCYCADCRKASGSGFIPFMGYDAGDRDLHFGRPDWAAVPPGLTCFDAMPG